MPKRIAGKYVLAHGISGIEAWTGAADWTYRVFSHEAMRKKS
jgi:ATP-dependent helicase/DNAse subunit B